MDRGSGFEIDDGRLEVRGRVAQLVERVQKEVAEWPVWFRTQLAPEEYSPSEMEERSLTDKKVHEDLTADA